MSEILVIVLPSNIMYYKVNVKYSSVRLIASRILHEIFLLIGELAIKRTNLTLIVRLGAKSDLLIEQYSELGKLLIHELCCMKIHIQSLGA